MRSGVGRNRHRSRVCCDGGWRWDKVKEAGVRGMTTLYFGAFVEQGLSVTGASFNDMLRPQSSRGLSDTGRPARRIAGTRRHGDTAGRTAQPHLKSLHETVHDCSFGTLSSNAAAADSGSSFTSKLSSQRLGSCFVLTHTGLNAGSRLVRWLCGNSPQVHGYCSEESLYTFGWRL